MVASGGERSFAPFDRLHEAIAGSAAYREAIRASSPDLPEWLTPASVINLGDLRIIAASLGVAEGQTIADLGCGAGGPGLWVAERTGASLIGVDTSAAAISIATGLADRRAMTDRARFIVSDFVATGLPDACADGIMSLDALMFVDPRGAALEIRRLMKPDTRIAVRAVETLVDPFMPTLVRDYRPVFEEAGLSILRHDEVADYPDRSLAHFRAIAERAGAIYAEIGAAADILIDEARESIAKAQNLPRVRTVFLVAQR